MPASLISQNSEVVTEMSSLHILELTSSNPDGLPRLPPVASQMISIGAASVTSAPFNEATRAVRLYAGIPCAIAVGQKPVASDEDTPLAPGVTQSFAVTAGHSLAVIARPVEDDMSIDPLAVLAAVGNPETSKPLLQEIVSERAALAKQRKEIKALAGKLESDRAALEADHERRKQELAEAEGAHAAQLTQLEKKQRDLMAQEAAAHDAANRLTALNLEIADRTDTLSRLNAQLSALRERFAA
jgi:hypothetical protein